MPPKESQSCWARIRHTFSLITVEPAYLIFAISQGLYLIVASELYISKVCKVNLALGDDICENIQQHKEQQVLVQKYVSTLRMYNSILQAIPSVLFALFSGPWSDTNGRKLLIVISLFGFVFNNGVYMINTYWFYELKAEYLLFECLQDMTGGFVTFFMSVNAYMADVTDPATRTKRVAFMSGLWPIGYNIGKALSGVIKVHLGFMYNFGIGMALSLVAMLYMIVFVKDSIAIRSKRLKLERALERAEAEANGEKLDSASRSSASSSDSDESERSKMEKFKDLFNLTNLKKGFQAILKKRPHHLRLYLLLMILCFEMEMFINVGEGSSMYLYLRRTLDFTMIDYTRYSIFVGVIGITAQYITIPLFSEYFKFHDSTIILIDIGGCFIQTLINSFATAEWMLYMSACIAFLDATSFTMIRCMISKHVDPDEIGKILSIVGALQSFMPLVSSPIFGTLYRNTVETMPNAFLLVLSGFFAIDWLVLMWINIGINKVYKKHEIEMQDMKKEEGAAAEKLMSVDEKKADT